MANEYNVGLAAVVREYLESQNWRFQWLEENGVFSMGMTISCKLHNCKVFVHIYKDGFLVRAVSPIYADPDDPGVMNRTAAYLHMVNYGMRNGAFEMDLADGEVAFKTYLFCGEELPSVKVVERYVDIAYIMLRNYGNGLAAVIFAGADPRAAVREAEEKDQEDDQVGEDLPGELNPLRFS